MRRTLSMDAPCGAEQPVRLDQLVDIVRARHHARIGLCPATARELGMRGCDVSPDRPCCQGLNEQNRISEPRDELNADRLDLPVVMPLEHCHRAGMVEKTPDCREGQLAWKIFDVLLGTDRLAGFAGAVPLDLPAVA